MAAIASEAKMSAEVRELLKEAKGGLFSKGEPWAQYDLGVRFENGQGVVKDKRQAAEWYRKSAEQGNSRSRFALGLILAKDRGIAKDEKQAVEWFRKAAKRELAEAQNALGWMYANGKGIAKDLKQAHEWFQKAVGQKINLTMANFNLGILYEAGLGVAKDEKIALEHYQKARMHGLDDKKAAGIYAGEARDGYEVAHLALRLMANRGIISAQEALKTLPDDLLTSTTEEGQKQKEKPKEETKTKQEKVAVTSSLPNVPCIAWKEITLGDLIGGGSFGKVYKGTWSQLKKETVAIKRLHQAVLSPSLAKAFKSEVENLSKCRHPSIVQLYGACIEPEHYAIIMEYMPTSLGERLRELPKLPWSKRLKIAFDIAQGVDYLHHLSRKILHRDLRSDNILLDDSHTQAKIADFGLSKLAAQIGNTTSIAFGKAHDSILWRAPELCVPGGKATPATDVYSLGIILLELVTCELPYGGEKDVTLLLTWKRNGEINISKDCPKALSELIQACIAVNPDKRPTASEVVSRLELFVKEAEKRKATIDQSNMKGRLAAVQKDLKKLHEQVHIRFDSVEIGIARAAYTPQLEALDPLPLAPQTSPAIVRQETARVV